MNYSYHSKKNLLFIGFSAHSVVFVDSCVSFEYI